jgi:hypothetical protein
MLKCRLSSFLLALASAVLLMAADSSWRAKPTAQWTEEDAAQVLSQSPWSRTVKAGVARRESEDELRDGGRMGQPIGVGYDNVDPKGSGPKFPANPLEIFTGSDLRSTRSLVQAMTLRLRWESALPVRLAELKYGEIPPPTLEGDGYRLAVYGIPNGDFTGDPKKLGDPLKEMAVLRRDGKKDVRPVRVEVFHQTNGSAVVYLFPLSAEITRMDGHVEFAAHIGRIVVAQVFNLAEMEFQGKLEL